MNNSHDPYSQMPSSHDPDPSEGGLQQRFPEMVPVRTPPALSTFNGIGLMVYGSRDHDAETGTYVKTLCFTLLFLPLFCLKAYRVADANPGWYFLGKVPLSGLAKAWNLIIVVLIAGGGLAAAWVHHTGTAEYKAGQQLAQADTAAALGRLSEAARIYSALALGITSHADDARTRLGALLDNPTGQDTPEEAVKVITIAVDVHRSGRNVERLYERGVDLARKYADKEPRTALKIADAVAFLAPADDDLSAFRLPILERLAASQPKDIEVLSELALIHESRRDFGRCEKLLAPHARSLGDKEGARILGQIYAHEGKLAQAYELLQPYTEERLKRWKRVEQAQKDAVKQVDDQVIAELRSGHAPGFDYRAYKTADQDTQARMVQDYLDNHLKDHPAFRRAMDDVRKEARVVPVALDFGIVLLRRAQEMSDPQKRRQELERAEKTFLAIRTAAEKSDEYRLFLGQVYYWLGRHAQGRKLFDELVQFKGGKTMTRLSVANALREVGAVSEARQMSEEAYAKESDAKFKQTAADMRALVSLDLDDRIAWLKRSDISQPSIKADLSTALAQDALRKNQDALAAQNYRDAIGIYESMPESPASLNNGAVAYFGLFHVTGDQAALDKGNANQQKALALKPDDTILLRNVAEGIQAGGLRAIVGKKIDLNLLKRSAGFDLVNYLWQDAAGREHYRKLLQSSSELTRARSHFERLRVMAPKSAGAWSALATLYVQTRDLKALRQLHAELPSAALDLADYKRRTFDNLQGKEDDKLRADIAGAEVRLMKDLQIARKAGGATLAVAAADVNLIRLSGAWLDRPVNADQVVALAEEAHQAAPSYATLGLKQTAWLFRADQTLRKEQPAYAKLAKEPHRTVGFADLIAIALSPESPPALRKACQANADVQHVFKLLREQLKKFPEHADEWDWAMFRTTYPEEAARFAETVKKNELRRLDRAIRFRLSPLSGAEAYRQHWMYLIDGDTKKALAVLGDFKKQGVSLPVLP